MKPAAPGTGVIAGGAARVILEEAGVHDVLCKSLGSSNAINVARATINGLQSLQRPDEVARRRGLAAEDFVPKGMLNAYNERKKQIARQEIHTDAADQERPQPARRLITVKQIRSTIANKPKTRGTLRALGLRKIGDTNTLPDRPRSAA